MFEKLNVFIASCPWFPWALLGMGIACAGLSMGLKRYKAHIAGRRSRKWVQVVLMGAAWAAITGAVVSALSEAAFREFILAWVTRKGIYSSLIWTAVTGCAIGVLSRILRAAILRGVEDIRVKHKIRRTIKWASYSVFGFITVFIWASRLQDLGVILGMFAAGVALSLQETLLCLAAWAVIIIKKPFDIGDRIEVGDFAGDVIDIQTFHFHLLEVGNWVDGDQSTGRMIMVPNSVIFRGKLSNYTKGFPFIWNEIKTIVTFDSDWRKAKQIILEQAQEEVDKIESEVRRQIMRMQRDFAISYENLTPIVYTKIEDIGVALSLRYLTPVRNRRGTGHQICESILEAFSKQEAIDFAYPTQTIYTVAGSKRAVRV